MATVLEICSYLEKLAPTNLAESWDNVGLLLGRRNRPVQRLMTCLTLTAPVSAEAVERKTQMIVTHHPILFRATKKITDATEEGRILLQLAEAGIAVYSPHTAFDSADRGINQQLAENLGLQHIQALRPGDDANSGAGRFGVLENPLDRQEFLEKVAMTVQSRSLEVCWHENQPVNQVAVACGAAAEFLEDAIRAGCDTFLTGEARFHSVLEAQSRGINLILTGHFASERPAIEQLAKEIAQQFPEIDCFPGDSDRDPLKLFIA
jgi:dinuclear metal center YbgI/SA1388 family protein